MKNTTLNRDDFNFTYSKGGYTIFYKNKPIGGAGTLNKGANLKGRQVKQQIIEYRVMAVADIHRILNGIGYPRYYEAIEKR